MDKELLEKIQSDMLNNTSIHIETGYSDLDSMLAECRKGSLITIGGVGSSGKSYFCRNILINQMVNNKKCLYFDLDNTKENLIKILVQMIAEIDRYKSVNHCLTSEDKSKIKIAISEMQAWDLEIFDSPCYKLDKIVDKILSIKPEYVFIDNMDGIRIDDKFNTDKILKILKDTADKIGTTIFVTTTIDSTAEKNKFNVPTDKSFNDSESVLKYSDEVIILHRADMFYLEEDMPEGFESRTINIYMHKNCKGVIRLFFDNRICKITSNSQSYEFK